MVEKLKGLECQAAPGCLVWQCPGCHLAHAAMWVKRDLQKAENIQKAIENDHLVRGFSH